MFVVLTAIENKNMGKFEPKQSLGTHNLLAYVSA